LFIQYFVMEKNIVAFGGELCPKTILYAYENGIFPWYNEGEPILWWSPDPRCVLYPEKLKISKSLRREIASNKYEISFNKNFKAVINYCKSIFRNGQNGTWITNEIEKTYTELHHMNFAHSVEVWYNNELVGGLYGIILGKCFFGESMFSKVPNASKIALYHWVEFLKSEGIGLIDCQVTNPHLLSLGAEEISKKSFLKELKYWIDK
jgi:leucyl/phenylalanyl-tRNA--protein transferase